MDEDKDIPVSFLMGGIVIQSSAFAFGWWIGHNLIEYFIR